MPLPSATAAEYNGGTATGAIRVGGHPGCKGEDQAMKRIRWFGLFGLAALLYAAGASTAADKGTVVELDGLKATTPAEWKEETPSNNLRHAQFKLPKVKDDKEDAEIVIFKGIPETVQGNVDRWKKDFRAPEGKKIDDTTKVNEVKVGKVPMTYVDIQGTYLYKMRPRDPSEKPQARADYRLLGVVFDVMVEDRKVPYQIRLIGPAKTVEHYQKGFEEWFKSFK
jgi:hypothetical protein